MAEVVYSRHAFTDLERLADFLVKEAPTAAVAGIDVIRDGIEILGRHPLVGRPCEEGLRELLISYGKSGYVALYSYEQREDVVLVLAIVISGKPAIRHRCRRFPRRGSMWPTALVRTPICGRSWAS